MLLRTEITAFFGKKKRKLLMKKLFVMMPGKPRTDMEG